MATRMNQSIKPGLVPPARGLEKEEPEQAYEADIPSDDDRPQSNERHTGGHVQSREDEGPK
jgi:hypothetical protein